MSGAFPGFNSGTEIVPTQFFEELLPEIDTLPEMKVTMFTFYLLNQYEGDQRYLLRTDYTEALPFMQGLSAETEEAEQLLNKGLEAAVKRGTLLSVDYGEVQLFFLNSPKGRAAIGSLEDGTWTPDAFLHLSGKSDLFRPNIFKIYEENIGPLTPMIADILRDSEKLYSSDWLADAVEQAVINNARSWRYIEAILKSWKENGRDGIYR